MNNLTYITIESTEINTVDFSEVIEPYPPERYSVDKTEFVVKWVAGSPYIPESILAVPEADRSALMDHSEVLTLMATEAWTEEMIP